MCVSSESGEVCANGGDGSITFSGAGWSRAPRCGWRTTRSARSCWWRKPDGSLDPGGAIGVMALFVGTEFTFAVTAIDDQGEPIVGDITVST